MRNQFGEYTKKPVTIAAMRYDGTVESAQEIILWTRHSAVLMQSTENIEHRLMIPTMEGDLHCSPGDVVIRGVKGEYYPCKPDIFDETYSKVLLPSERKTEGMDFGEAIRQAKAGKKITRKGWNGKDMFVVRQKGYPEGIPSNKQTAEAFGLEEGDLFKVRPYYQMRCADGSHQMWLASQSDIDAEDWEVVL